MTAATAPRNGLRHGDISYLTVRVADTAKARAFCEPLFGWTFSPGDPSPRSQVGESGRRWESARTAEPSVWSWTGWRT